MPTLVRLAAVLACDVADLVAGLGDHRHLDAHAGEVDRRDFLVGAASMALSASATPLLPRFVPGDRLGVIDVDRIRSGLAELHALDTRAGGAAAYQRALDQADAVGQLLDEATYDSVTGTELRVLQGELWHLAGWTAHDLGRTVDACRGLDDAMRTGWITRSDRLVVMAMASMTLQRMRPRFVLGEFAIPHTRAGREVVEPAQAARRTAQAWGSRRLHSLFAARAALGHSRGGDGQAAARALAESEALLDERDDPEPWLAFWGQADLLSVAAGVRSYLGEWGAAERAYHEAIEATPPGYERNRTLYQAGLAFVFVQQGAVEEGAAAVVEAMAGVRSGRSTSLLRCLRPALAPHASKQDVAEALAVLA